MMIKSVCPDTQNGRPIYKHYLFHNSASNIILPQQRPRRGAPFPPPLLEMHKENVEEAS